MPSLRKRLRARRIRRSSDVDLIRRSRYFDERFYRQQAQLPPGIDAAEHYLHEGYLQGHAPSAAFSGERYLLVNPDVRAAGMNPLAHYERFGCLEGRNTGMPHTPAQDGYYERAGLRVVQRAWGRLVRADKLRRNADARVLVIVHLFYPTAIGEICQYLHNLDPYHPHIVACYVEGRCTGDDLEPLTQFPGIELRPVENRGYDLASFFDIISHVDLDAYDVVFKLHSKSASRERLTYQSRFGRREWFVRLFDGIVGPTTVHDSIDLLMRDSSCGLVAERKVLSLPEPDHMRRMVCHALQERGLPVPAGRYHFVAGTCFAARARALEPLARLGITDADFDAAPYGVFTLAHALERLIGSEIERQGLRLQGVATHPLWAAWSASIARRRYRYNNQRIREELGLRFSDDDLLCLDGNFFVSWSLDQVELGDLLARDAQNNVVALRELDGAFQRKYGGAWRLSEELTAFVNAHFMVQDDPGLADIDELPWSQAIVAKADGYLMCGHDVAFELYRQRGPHAQVPVARYVERQV